MKNARKDKERSSISFVVLVDRLYISSAPSKENCSARSERLTGCKHASDVVGSSLPNYGGISRLSIRIG